MAEVDDRLGAGKNRGKTTKAQTTEWDSPGADTSAVEKPNPKPNAFIHSDDYRTIQLNGEKYILTPNQARIIEALHQAHEQGLPGLSSAFLLEKNPARDAAVNLRAAEPQETYAYSLEEIQTILALLPEPAATAFAVAAFMGLRHGEIQGLLCENYRDGKLFVSPSIWNGRITDPKTRKSRALFL